MTMSIDWQEKGGKCGMVPSLVYERRSEKRVLRAF